MGDKKAKIFKVQNLYGTHGRRSDGHKCGGLDLESRGCSKNRHFKLKKLSQSPQFSEGVG